MLALLALNLQSLNNLKFQHIYCSLNIETSISYFNAAVNPKSPFNISTILYGNPKPCNTDSALELIYLILHSFAHFTELN